MVKREGKETVMEEELTANSDNISCATKRKGDDTANSASSARKRKSKISMIEAPPAREVDLNTIQFLFEKKLKKNDVSGHSRIIIPKGDGEKFLPKVKEDESIYIFMDDMKVTKVWAFELRFASLQTDGSKMLLLENTAEFIEAHDIKVGDYIIVYKDSVTQRYVVGFRQEYNNDFSDVYRPELAPPEETNQIFSPNHKFDIDVDTAALGMTKEEFLDLNPFDWFPNDK